MPDHAEFGDTDKCNTLKNVCEFNNGLDVPVMEDKINSIVGVVENGLFSKNKPIVFIAKEDGTVENRNLD